MKIMNVRRRRLKWIIFIAFLIAATILGVLMLRKYYDRKHTAVAPALPGRAGTMRISLFFASPDGNGLMREGSEIDACGHNLADCVRNTVEKLVDGPLGDLAPTLPAATIVNSVQVRDETAYLDFSKELVDGLPGGSSAEATAVYSIVDTVSFNFPGIKKVKFLLDGHEMETLKGHLDLRMPLAPDFSMEISKDGQTAPEQK